MQFICSADCVQSVSAFLSSKSSPEFWDALDGKGLEQCNSMPRDSPQPNLIHTAPTMFSLVGK